MFEGALLDRHLRGCSSCRAFADGIVAQTVLLRGLPLEEPEQAIEPELPVPGRRRLRAAAVTFAGAAAAAAAAALLVFHPGATGSPTSSRPESGALRTGFLVDVASDQDLPAPRTQTGPAEAPGIDAVRGVFSQPA